MVRNVSRCGLDLAAASGIGCTAGDFSLAQLHTADELFVTGTMGGIVPVLALDGRTIGAGAPGGVTRRLAGLFAELTASAGTEII